MRDIARRSLLAGLSASPAAIVAASLPLPALAAPAATAGPADAGVTALAVQVTRLCRLSDRAHDRAARKADAVMVARGPRPVEPDPWGGSTEVEELPVDPTSDVERRFTLTMRKPPADHTAAKQRYAETLATWQAKTDRLEREAGTAGAAALCDSLLDRLQGAVYTLMATRATSPAGLAAKARAFLVLTDGREVEDGTEALGRSLARDVLRIGGQAHG